MPPVLFPPVPAPPVPLVLLPPAPVLLAEPAVPVDPVVELVVEPVATRLDDALAPPLPAASSPPVMPKIALQSAIVVAAWAIPADRAALVEWGLDTRSMRGASYTGAMRSASRAILLATAIAACARSAVARRRALARQHPGARAIPFLSRTISWISPAIASVLAAAARASA